MSFNDLSKLRKAAEHAAEQIKIAKKADTAEAAPASVKKPG